ncbi:MAG: BT4734/BF3469 family protein [Bacteroidota bacterium]
MLRLSPPPSRTDYWVTVFRRFHRVVGQFPLPQLMEELRRPHLAPAVQAIRRALATDREELAQVLKKQLWAFTPSGQFVGGRRLVHLRRYQGLIVLDLDRLGADLEACKAAARAAIFTRACFVSPSGRGLKILVATDNGPDQHRQAFAQVAAHYESLLGVAADPSGKDIPRLCFMSYDPTAYYHPQSTVFNVRPLASLPRRISAPPERKANPATVPERPARPLPSIAGATFTDCVARTERQQSYVPGNRNNFLYRLALHCRRAGLPQPQALARVLDHYDLPATEIRATVRSAYRAVPQPRTHSRPVAPPVPATELRASPTLAHKIYVKLPHLLREACAVFPDHRQRDLLLTSLLTTLGAALTRVRGHYGGKCWKPQWSTLLLAAHWPFPPSRMRVLLPPAFRQHLTSAPVATANIAPARLLWGQALEGQRYWAGLPPVVRASWLAYAVPESQSAAPPPALDARAFRQTFAPAVAECVHFLAQHPTRFAFTTEQEREWRSFLLEREGHPHGENPQLAERRGALGFRLAMVLSACRKYEWGATEENWSCGATDFALARWLLEGYGDLHHAESPG